MVAKINVKWPIFAGSISNKVKFPTVIVTGPFMARHNTASSLPYIQVGPTPGDVADLEWSTHDHHP